MIATNHKDIEDPIQISGTRSGIGEHCSYHATEITPGAPPSGCILPHADVVVGFFYNDTKLVVALRVDGGDRVDPVGR
ncbi:MAG: hypothetical protein ACXV3D_02095 [Halobacteriota archaeon]